MTFKISNKNFLITGGTGQIGSFLTEKLLENNANVTVLGHNIENLKEIKNLVNTKKIKFIECDLTNGDRIKKIGPLLHDIDFFVHLSSELKLPEPDAISSAYHTIELDIKSTVLLLQQLKQLQGILFTSSVAVYGKPSYIPVDELCPIEPISFYGCGKFAAEKYLKLHSNDKDVPLTILRISTVYGQRDRSNQMIPVFMRKALRDESIDLYGSSSRDFIHISDVIKVIMSAIKLNQNNLFNIGTGKKFSNQFILKKIIEITKSESKVTYLEKSTEYDFLCDNSKAIKDLDFNPIVSIEEGLVDEMLWYEKEIQKQSNNE